MDKQHFLVFMVLCLTSVLACDPGIDITMVDIPGGSFEMGCSGDDSDCADDEFSPHPVTISAFKMSAYEITQGQWKAVMGSNPSFYSFCGKDCPVEQVSWENIQDFINELNQQTGQNYRLPTEAEWEYAARAGSTTKWYCGDDESCLDHIAWYSANSDDKPHPVGQKQPNAWGLYDMTGNVWELVHDWYDSDYYEVSPGADPEGPDSGSNRVDRGGSWNSIARICRSSHRSDCSPSRRSGNLGFRLALP